MWGEEILRVGGRNQMFTFKINFIKIIKAGPMEMKSQLDQEGGHRHFLCLDNINYKLM